MSAAVDNWCSGIFDNYLALESRTMPAANMLSVQVLFNLNGSHMKNILFIYLAITISSRIFAQTTNRKDKDRAVQEIQALFNELNQAILKHDQKKLERIYADEFLFIHGLGFIETKAELINSIMETDSVRPVPLPSFDQFYLYGDVGVLRSLTRNPVAGNNLMSTTIYTKKSGYWQIVQVQSTQQQKERKSVNVDVKLLDTYIGKYVLPNGVSSEISREGDVLFVQRKGHPKLRLLATSNNQFYDKFGASYTFNEGSEIITSFTVRHQNGQEIVWVKSQ